MIENNCEIIRDLLPLYVDDVCSEPSRKLVESHLSECSQCAEVEKKIRDTNMETAVSQECRSVLDNHAKKERRAARTAGVTIAFLLAFPVLITAVVIISGKGRFSVLPILCSAMMLAASITVVPLISKENKFPRTVLAFCASLLLIEFFSCLYMGASFTRAAVPTVFALSIPFLPFAMRLFPVPSWVNERKLVSCIAWDTAWLCLTIFVELMPQTGHAAFREGMVTSALLLASVAVAVVIVRLVKSDLGTPVKVIIALMAAALWAAMTKEIFAGIPGFIAGAADITNWSIVNITNNIILTLIGSVIFFFSVFALVHIVKALVQDMD